MAKQEILEAQAAYLRQGYEVALETAFVDLESVHAHARHILDTCDGGRLLLDRFRHQIERAESAERERDSLLAAIDHLRLLGRTNGLTLKQYRAKAAEYLERAFFDSPTVEKWKGEAHALRERLIAAEKIKEAAESVYIVLFTMDKGARWDVQKVFRDKACAKSFVRKLRRTWGDSFMILAEHVLG